MDGNDPKIAPPKVIGPEFHIIFEEIHNVKSEITGESYLLGRDFMGAPIIQSVKTGNKVDFYWSWLIDQAIALGIDVEPSTDAEDGQGAM